MADPFQEFNRIVDAWVDAEQNPDVIEGALRMAQPIARAGCIEHFENQQAPDGTPWPALTWPRPEGGSRILENTGRLKASIQATAEGNELHVHTNRIGAGAMNFGATIVPINVSWLTIPATIEAKRAGGARDFPGKLKFMIFTERYGHAIDSEGVVQYVLLKKVTIPKREFLGFSGETQEAVLNMVADKFGEYALNGGSTT